MTLVLDAGGLTALAGRRARLQELLRRGLWPAHVPAVVLTADPQDLRALVEHTAHPVTVALA